MTIPPLVVTLLEEIIPLPVDGPLPSLDKVVNMAGGEKVLPIQFQSKDWGFEPRTPGWCTQSLVQDCFHEIEHQTRNRSIITSHN